MGGRNEQANPRSRNNGNDCSVQSVNVKSISPQVTTCGFGIEDPEPGKISVNKLYTNADTCFLGSNFMVPRMTSRIADVYPYNPSYKPLYNVPIVSGATIVTDSITGKCSYSDNSTDEAVINAINPALVELGAKIKRKVSEITTPANVEIPERRNFFSSKALEGISRADC